MLIVGDPVNVLPRYSWIPFIVSALLPWLQWAFASTSQHLYPFRGLFLDPGNCLALGAESWKCLQSILTPGGP